MHCLAFGLFGDLETNFIEILFILSFLSYFPIIQDSLGVAFLDSFLGEPLNCIIDIKQFSFSFL